MKRGYGLKLEALAWLWVSVAFLAWMLQFADVISAMLQLFGISDPPINFK